MRQTIREIEVNLAYRWFLELGMYEKVPHFSTFRKNYTRRFKGTDLFEQIFSKLLQTCIDAGLVDLSEAFIDATHVKACANDCYICPANKILKYSTTNREGYREYKSNSQDCESCSYLSQCTESKNHVKLIARHI